MQLGLPSKVKVGAVTYRLSAVATDVTPKGTSNWGYTDHSKALIYVDTDMNIEHVKDTLIHEILHVICLVFDVKSNEAEERIVAPIASGLTAVFKDNPKILKFLQQ